VDPPVFLSTTFPHPLNEVSPDWSARLPPPDTLRHGVPAGTVPRPRTVPAHALPEMLVLNAEVGQRGVDAETLDYERYGQDIWLEESGMNILPNMPVLRIWKEFMRIRIRLALSLLI